ncbi:MAG TPA: methyltransferase domain-containing protein [Acidimicrobiales bacterium]|nr:methyltransferase domain-containing protein [Acidimicrobiales bacterium]
MPDTYSHGHHESVLRSHRNRTVDNSAAYLIPHLRAGLDVLDVGCGPGSITVDLATRVAPGRVIGIDAADDAIAAARALGAEGVAFAVGDAYNLDFPDASFDVVHAHQVLQHLTDPVAALREWRRVLKPGGIVAARDGVYSSFAWYPADPVLDRWLALYHQLTDHNAAEADAGVFLPHWAAEAGFDDVVFSASNWAYATPETRQWWGGLWADRALESSFATQTLEYGLTTPGELEEIAAAWRRWAAQPDASFIVVHGEVICRK